MDRRQLLKGSGYAILGAGVLGPQDLIAQTHTGKATQTASAAACACDKGADGTPLDTGTSEMIPVVERYDLELSELNRMFLPGSALHRGKSEAFYAGQLHLLESFHFDAMSQSGKVDYLLLRSHIEDGQRQLAANAKQEAEVAAILPFQQDIYGLEEARRRMETLDEKKSAATLAALTAQLAKAKPPADANPAVLGRAASRVQELRGVLQQWSTFYALYDPLFAFWIDEELKRTDAALGKYAEGLFAASGLPGTLEPVPVIGRGGPGGPGGPGGRGGGGGNGGGNRQRVRSDAPLGSEKEIAGIGPVGHDELQDELRRAWIPYTPEELITLANKEFEWCDREMMKASAEMGLGNDWKAAQEKAKNMYVEPGQMIYWVRDNARKAIAFMDTHEVLTIPEGAKQDWWEQAMTPQQQLVNPFFTGGQTIQVSSPASSMPYDEKLASQRANNIPQAYATVFHELVPGHHMQSYMTARYRTYRRSFAGAGPFWSEGMAFYWEMLMWDLGWFHTPEERVGALFWRKERCARIIFSVKFNLKQMAALECVEFLIDRVGHDRPSAEGEVRRSFNGSYSPIYQCAYMLGALQFYALHKELVGGGKMSNRQFHDAFYREGNMPIEMVRAQIANIPLTRDYQSTWKFYGNLS
ncbi:MAG TPA: DUF885 family protein [Acidobacteriaceae bacterium]|jgi:hypothetical protein